MDGSPAAGTRLTPAAAAAAPPPPRGAVTAGARARRAAQHILALLLPAAVTLATIGPWILRRMQTAILASQPQDGSIFIWMLRWWPYALAHRLDPFYTTRAWAPGGINLAWVTSIPAPAILLSPLTGAAGPFASFNAVELAAPALAAWTAYLLCRRITGSFIPALAGGLIFGFASSLLYELGQGHPNLTLVFLIPLAAYLVLRLLDGSLRAYWAVPLLGLVTGTEFYISTEVATTYTLMGVLFAVTALWLGGPVWRRRLARSAIPLAAGYLTGLAIAAPLLVTAFTRPRPYKPLYWESIGHGVHNARDFLRYFIPGRYTILGTSPVGGWGRDGSPWYFGIPLTILLVVIVITGWRSRRTRVLAAGLALTLVLSMGSAFAVFGAHIMPWRLFSVLPIVSRVQPGRLVSYAFLIAAILVATWLARPGKRPLRWAAALVAVAALLPNFSTNVWSVRIPTPVLLTHGGYRQYVSPGQIVWLVTPRHAQPMVWQARTNMAFRTAGGFFGVTPPRLPNPAVQVRLGAGTVTRASVAEIRTFLRAHRVGVVLMAGYRPGEVRVMQRATGVRPFWQGSMVVFLLPPGPGAAR
jgi:hypothetical protein